MLCANIDDSRLGLGGGGEFGAGRLEGRPWRGPLKRIRPLGRRVEECKVVICLIGVCGNVFYLFIDVFV
jgi:hypothetical protein